MVAILYSLLLLQL